MSDDSGRLRLRIFGFVALSLFGALFARLWYLQVLERAYRRDGFRPIPPSPKD